MSSTRSPFVWSKPEKNVWQTSHWVLISFIITKHIFSYKLLFSIDLSEQHVWQKVGYGLYWQIFGGHNNRYGLYIFCSTSFKLLDEGCSSFYSQPSPPPPPRIYCLSTPFKKISRVSRFSWLLQRKNVKSPIQKPAFLRWLFLGGGGGVLDQD